MMGSDARAHDQTACGCLILERDLQRSLHMAALLERRGARIVGIAWNSSSALAIAEGEEADFAALNADVPPLDLRRRTAALLFTELGIPTLTIAANGDARVLRNRS